MEKSVSFEYYIYRVGVSTQAPVGFPATLSLNHFLWVPPIKIPAPLGRWVPTLVSLDTIH